MVLENETLHIDINPRGAELTSIFHKQNNIEYLWNGNPEFWSKQSPVLFPIVGSLLGNTFFFNHEAYNLSRHGFARDKEFSIVDESGDSITFSLTHDTEILKVYPFHFNLFIKYSVSGNQLSVQYRVENPDDGKLYFSIGAHPAFRVPLVPTSSFNDYYLLFDSFETAPRWPLTADGLIRTEPVVFFENSNRIQLTKELFHNDALVFKNLASSAVSINSINTEHGIKISLQGFPYLGIWSAKNADFVCIEPWCGIADSESTNQQLGDKEGINILQKNETFSRTWTANLY